MKPSDRYSFSRTAALAATCCFLLAPFVAISDSPAQDSPNVKHQGRPAWTTSRITGSPEPPLPYVTERAFPSIRFDQCLDITAAPGSGRLFVVQQSGKIYSFRDDPATDKIDLVTNLRKQIDGVEQVYALAFHPDFRNNRYCYVCYIKAANRDDGTHVARFRMAETDPPTLDLASEQTVITWLSGGHNGCCLKFGPDGYLYVSTGDGGPANPPDPKRAGQDVGNLLSCILRLDVDHSDDGRNYRIPPDNPFVDLPGARGEIWAYGLRNPWRMSFDPDTGDLWVGDVGWELWEMLYRVQKGGNYGWAVMEGRQTTHPEWPRGPTPILPPTIDHPHSESSSITDGLTYRGDRLTELDGVHIYGDYDTGKIWGFRFQDGTVVDHRELADTTHRIVGFGEDDRGEAYLLDHVAGTIHRLVPNPRRDRSDEFPRRLSETGLYSSVAELRPAPGVVPYEINAEPWHDHALARRLVAVPGDSSIEAGDSWRFAVDSVLVKTLSLEMRRGDPSSRRLVETQILHFDGTDWQPYCYRWDDEQTDARLVEASGDEQSFDVVDPSAPDGVRRQTWRFAGRAECARCHNKWSGPMLAFHPAQLDDSRGKPDSATSQLARLTGIGLLDRRVAANEMTLVDPRDSSADLNARARAYLHVNCAHCHRMHAGGAVLAKMHYDLPLDKTDMLGVRPSQGTFGILAAQIVAPRDPCRSVLLHRMAKLGGGRMPHIGSTEVDREGVMLMREWITSMLEPGRTDDDGDVAARNLRHQESHRLDALRSATTDEERAEPVADLLSSTSGALMLLLAIEDGSLPREARTTVIETAIHHPEPTVRDLFERFVPVEQRTKRLGSVVSPQRILSLTGDASVGRRVFLEVEGVSCKNCHRIGDQGGQVGPDLSKIGGKYDRARLLESILEPSKQIDPTFVTYVVETDDGRVLSGVLETKDDREVVLRDAENRQVRIATERIDRLVPQHRSLMPDLLLRDMTAQQVADLLAYLSSLR